MKLLQSFSYMMPVLGCLLFSTQGRAELVVGAVSKHLSKSSMAREALKEIFEAKNIHEIMENFVPENTGWEWKRVAITPEEEITRFHFAIQKGKVQKPVVSTTAVTEAVASSGWGLWGGLKTKLSSAKGYLENAAIKYKVGNELNLKGDVISGTIDCPAPFERVGYQLDVDLAESDEWIFLAAKKFSIRVCLGGESSPTDGVKLNTSMSLIPGEWYENVEPNYFLEKREELTPKLIQSLLPAWANALEESTLSHQFQLLNGG